MNNNVDVLRGVLSDLLEAKSTLACMAQPQLVALDRAVERIEALAIQEQAEPVAAQCRFKSEPTCRECSVEHAHMVLANPEEWVNGYEVRFLSVYTTVQQLTHPERQPLTDEQWLKLFTHHSGQRLKPGTRRDELLSLIRWVERNVAGGKGVAA